MVFSFLLVSLKIDAILSEITLSRRRNKLDEMTKGDGLGGAYTETISRIQAQPGNKSKLGMDVLMWVSHAERPLHVNELCHALGVEGSIDLDIQNIPAIETLLACTLGLVTVEKSSSTVRLVHYTLQEYLSHNSNLFPNPHLMIAEACLTYLNFPHVRGFSPTLCSVPPTAPFVEYASCYWGTHARWETTESVKALALKLLAEYDTHISSRILSLHSESSWWQSRDRDGTPTGFTRLHCAAYFGCVEIVVALLNTNKGDVQATDSKGNTAIAWASRRGHEGVVRVLLERSDIDLDKVDRRKPLSCAAENGHDGVVRILLGLNDVGPNKPDKDRQAILLWASGRGYSSIVRVLLEQNDVNPDKSGRWHRTPLSWASGEGNEEVVRMLLERNDVNPDKSDRWHRTPLSWASGEGNEEVVRILLERNDVNPDKPDRWHRTPLSWASGKGDGGMVRMLLERNDVNPNKPDRWHRTPLSWASGGGHEGIVRMLLERNDVNPKRRDLFGKTPLYWASRGGHEGVVKVLQERNEANPHTWRRALLRWTSRGHADA